MRLWIRGTRLALLPLLLLAYVSGPDSNSAGGPDRPENPRGGGYTGWGGIFAVAISTQLIDGDGFTPNFRGKSEISVRGTN